MTTSTSTDTNTATDTSTDASTSPTATTSTETSTSPTATATAAPAATPAAAAKPADPPAWAKRRGSDGTAWGKQAPTKPHATERLRQTIQGLPDWEPLPPGEIQVRRGGKNG